MGVEKIRHIAYKNVEIKTRLQIKTKNLIIKLTGMINLPFYPYIDLDLVNTLRDYITVNYQLTKGYDGGEIVPPPIKKSH